MSNEDRVKVLIVDDSAFARKVLREALQRDPRLAVVGTARDGLEALERITELSPDVVTLDLVMPNLDGIGFLQALPATNAPRVVVVTTADAGSDLAVAALAAGAVDFVHKPTALATDRLYELSEELRDKVVLAAGARALRAALPEDVSTPWRSVDDVAPSRKGNIELVVIGTSTGGPQALSRLIPMLPAKLPVPVLVALHIPRGYTEALARRLDAASAVSVVEVPDAGIELRPGLVVVARGGEHLTLVRQNGVVVAVIEGSRLDASYSPSVDHLFRAAAREYGARALGVVLTGMGNDGLEGSRAIRKSGGKILVESAASSVIYGMPRVVSEAGLSTEEAHLDRMVSTILAHL
ncbi:MAG TPA: chemotaxis-specific protein-glutamate methyltransferase CheB [Polyangiaceae bacterium]|jgi:two-component system chemotaxis response regulator CheB|nr:chemotaxis-specific protein-glutamate methyltransferase CheB [Polyangiaceae bacterium]